MIYNGHSSYRKFAPNNNKGIKLDMAYCLVNWILFIEYTDKIAQKKQLAKYYKADAYFYFNLFIT